MSLVVVVYTPVGMVLSTDSRTTLTKDLDVPHSQDPGIIVKYKSLVPLSDSFDKAFIVYKRFAVGVCGDIYFNNLPIGHYIQEFEKAPPSPNITTEELATKLFDYFVLLAPNLKSYIFVAGYDAVDPWVLLINLAAKTVVRQNFDAATKSLIYGLAFGGETAVINRLCTPAEHTPQIFNMTLQDAVDLSRHLIRTTIDQLRFEAKSPTVGGPIDTIIVTPTESRFLAQKQLSAR